MDDHASTEVTVTAESAPTPARVPRRGCVPVVLGIITVLIGVPMLICPGPGLAVVMAGFGMIAGGLGIARREPDQGQ